MRFSQCLKCSSMNFVVKSGRITTNSNLASIIPISKFELFYIKTCCDCAFTEIYDAKILDEYSNKKMSKY